MTTLTGVSIVRELISAKTFLSFLIVHAFDDHFPDLSVAREDKALLFTIRSIVSFLLKLSSVFLLGSPV